MTEITFFKDKDGAYRGFECKGHAGYADKGRDIVCAGISALVINTVNAMERLTAERFTVDSGKEDGRIALRLLGAAGHDAALLLDSLALGLEGIQDTYGDGYVALGFKEV